MKLKTLCLLSLLLTSVVFAQKADLIPPTPRLVMCGDPSGFYPSSEIPAQVLLIHKQGCRNATWVQNGDFDAYFIYGTKIEE